MPRLTKLALALLAGALFACLPRAARAGTPQPELSAVRGDQSRSEFGQGAGVTIGIVDGGLNSAHPALHGAVTLQQDFTGEGILTDNLRTQGHGTGIAGIYVGSYAGYTGLAPKARIINARVANTADYTNDNIMGDGMFYAINHGARIVNISLGNATQDPWNNKMDLMIDYAAEHYKTLVVVATGDTGDATDYQASAVQDDPGGAYNNFTIGALTGRGYTQVAGSSDYALPSDVRSKPDLVAPGTGITLADAAFATSHRPTFVQGDGTSFAAPIVGGVLAQMVGYGQAKNLPTDPLLLKAILLTSADHVQDPDGSAWAPKAEHFTHGRTLVIDQSLSAEQGAGQVDGAAAYSLYTRSPNRVAPVEQWREASMGQGDAYTVNLGTLRRGQEVDSTLTWLRHVMFKSTGSSSVTGEGSFFPKGTLANFTLTLKLDGKDVVNVDSTADNLQHLSCVVGKTGNYTLEIDRLTGTGQSVEDYALATTVLAGAQFAPSIDAADMTAGYAGGTSPGMLRSLEPAATSIPEPGVLGVGLIVLGMLRRRRARG